MIKKSKYTNGAIRVNVRVSEDVHIIMQKISKKMALPVSSVMAIAMQEYLNNHFSDFKDFIDNKEQNIK